METQDPQDTAILLDTIPQEELQHTVPVKSVYEGLVALSSDGGKLYRTHGHRAGFMRFDLTAHSVFVGNTFIISNGVLKMPVLETASKYIDLTGLPWLTEEERKLDPLDLYDNHWLSRPNGAEKFIYSNFPAQDIDEMSDDDMLRGANRNEARVRLEAWILCAALDGTLKKYVTSQPGWVDGHWWWSPTSAEGNNARRKNKSKPAIVVRTEWWRDASTGTWTATPGEGGTVISSNTGSVVATVPGNIDAMTVRAIQSVPQLMRLAKSLSREAFTLQRRAKCYDIDPVICEVNRTISFIETGSNA